MRVLTVGNRYPPAGTGGYERVWQAAVAGLRTTGHEVEVLTTEGGPPGPLLESTSGAAGTPPAPEPGVHRVLRWPWTPEGWERPGPIVAVRRERHNAAAFEALAREADLVCWFSMGGLSLSLISRCDAPQLAVAHDGWPLYGPGVDPWTARWGRAGRHRYDPRRVEHWSANSAYTRDRLLTGIPGLDPARFSVEHPGIDPAAFPEASPRDWTGELLVLGRVEEGKGVSDAIRARPDGARLTVAGPVGPVQLAELIALADRGDGGPTAPAASGQGGDPPDQVGATASGDRVRFTGPTGDPARAIAAADVVLFPVTWPEPFGLVPLEAMAVGRPVIATGTGGSAEYLRDGENALLVPPGDPSALRGAIERLAAEPELRERLLAGGRTTAARFTEATWTAGIVAHAERLGGEGSGGATRPACSGIHP